MEAVEQVSRNVEVKRIFVDIHILSILVSDEGHVVTESEGVMYE